MTPRSRIRAALALALVLGCGDDAQAPDEAAEGGGGSTTGTASPSDASSSGESTAGPGGADEGSEGAGGGHGSESGGALPPVDSPCAIEDGRCIFRHDTFGDEQLWTDVLRVNELVETLTPRRVLALGLKLDLEVIPEGALHAIELDDPSWTVRLLEHHAVVGLRARVEGQTVTRLGVTCALCHSTVDDAAGPGIGMRLDGWPNRDLDVGSILASAPGLADYAADRGVEVALLEEGYGSWGPGRYDPRFNMDLQSAPVLIPPAYGLAEVPLVTYTGDGGISYWNAYVAVTQLGGQGTFGDPALGLDIDHDPDLVMPKLPALRAYQHELMPPVPEGHDFDFDAIARGKLVFLGDGHCGDCHTGAAFTDAPLLHDPAALGLDQTEAQRSKSGRYRTTPLRGAWQHPPYFHDGSAADFDEVIDHYEEVFALGLTGQQRSDLVAYLRAL